MATNYSSNNTTMVWGTWVQGTTSSTSTNGVWSVWVDQGTTSAYQNNVWQAWQNSTAVTVVYNNVPQPPPETEEQRTARLAREAEWRRQSEEAAQLRQVAEERARQLLLEVLDDEQAAELAKDNRFHVKVRDPRDRRFRTFRIGCHGTAGNITELDEHGKGRYKYCIHLTGWEPREDSWVAQKLMLETDLEAFERIANRSLAGAY